MDGPVRVRTFPRIHMTLIDLAGATRRRFGGVGFTLNSMPATVLAQRASRNVLKVAPNLDERDLHDLETYVTRISKATKECFRVDVTSIMRQHIGLGSKTALLLAAGLACNAAAGTPLNRRDLVLMSGRGGTSGVGVNTTFVGGLVADGGQRADTEAAFQPSSVVQPRDVPPLLVRQAFPTNWRIHLFLPSDEGCYGADEVFFFRNNTPIGIDEAMKVLGAVYHGIVPSFADADLETLSAAVEEIQGTGFKRREIDRHGDVVRGLLHSLRVDERVARGMSSMGPLVYAIAPQEVDITENSEMSSVLAAGVEYLGSVAGRNEGYEIERCG